MDEDNESHENRYKNQDDDEFSMSSYDGDQGDSLDIKPPQAMVVRREKREKRDKRDRHRRKGDRHKRDRDHSREHRNASLGLGMLPGQSHEERRREHRRHRNMERREGRRHEKHKDRSSKHERAQMGEFRKSDKERKMDRRKDRPSRSEYPEDFDRGGKYHMRSYSGGFPPEGRGSFDQEHNSSLPMPQQYHESREDRFHGLLPGPHLSPSENEEREKRMSRLMMADQQKELSQRDADVRRQRREVERKEEFRQQRIDSKERQRAYEAHEMHKRRKHHHYPESDNDDIQILSDDDDEMSAEQRSNERDRNQEEGKRSRGDARRLEHAARNKEDYNSSKDRDRDTNSPDKREEAASSGSSDSETDSDSDTSSSDSDEDEDSDTKDTKDNRSNNDHKNQSSSTDTSPARRSDLDERSDFDDEIGDSSPGSPLELKEELPAYYPAIMGCRSVDEFVCLNRIEEGTYGVVYRAREKSNNDIVALKRLKMEKEKEGFPITSLREVNTLLKGQHKNIVTVREIVVGSNMDKIYIVMDYVEHDLKSLMETMRRKKQSFTIGETKTLMIQLLRAVHHLHDNWILHRDLKTSNLLLSHRGILKVGDFGLAREYGSPLKSYTPIVVTLWYRAPELLLGAKEYSTPIDVWSVGCIFGELLGMEPMFPGKSEIDQLNKIFKDLGTPSDKIWPGYSQLSVVRKTQFADYPYNHLREKYNNRLSDEGFKLLNKFLTYNPSVRVKCNEALDHKYFTEELPAPVDPAMFPTWPAKSENPHDKTKKTGNSPKPPSGGKNFKDLGDGEDENIAAGHGFFLGEAVQPGAGFMLKF